MVAQAEAGLAGQVAPNPRLTVGTTERGARATASFYAFLPFLGRRQAAIGAGEAQAAVVAAGVDVARLDALLATGRAWVDLWLAERESDTAEESARRWERLAEIADERVASGDASRLDAMRAHAEAARARAEVDALLELRSGAAARLSIALDRDPSSPLATEGSLPAVRALPELATLMASLDAHPLLTRARASDSAAEAGVRWQRRSRWPIFGVQAGASIAARSGAPNDFSGAMLLDLPVFSGPGLHRARAEETLVRSEGEVERRRLESELADAYARCRAAERRLRAQVDDVLPSAREVAELALEAYREGRLDMTAVLVAEQGYLDALRMTRRAEAELALALANLDHAVGR